MAEAVRKTIERVTYETTYALRLSTEEADTLVAVLASVGGSMEDSPRKHAHAVLTELGAAGAKFWDVAKGERATGHPINLIDESGRSASIFFHDYPDER